MFKVAIIGKPNVGKSTLFNKLCKRRIAITHDRPGVTRDAKEFDAEISGIKFNLIDTAGLERSKDDLTKAMFEKAITSAQAADLILFVIDGRRDLDSEDLHFGKELRKLGKKIIVVVNKCENPKVIDYNQAHKFGFEEICYVSSEHSLGFDDLNSLIIKHFELLISKDESLANPQDDDEKKERPLSVSIIGRPNVGKSTFFNKLIGQERSIVADFSGTTRDSINYMYDNDGKQIEFIDTAGLRKKAAITDSVEQLSSVESINALRRSHITIMMIDATTPLEKQDFSILRVAINEGRAVVLVINKIDLIDHVKDYKQDIFEFVDEKLFEIKGVPIRFISARDDRSVHKVLDDVIAINKIFNTQLSTGKLNKWLDGATSSHLPPVSKTGKRYRFKYMTQSSVRPPTFTIFTSQTEGLPESYTRYLYNSLRSTFDLFGVPIRIRYKMSNNPYAKGKK